MDILAQVLEKEERENAKYKPTDVSKPLELDLDLGNLLASDSNDLDVDALKSTGSKREGYLKEVARDDAQLLLNALWALPMERVEEIVVAKLPSVRTVTPREKPCPKPKQMTKWQKYALEKGIANKKKTNVEWDDELKKWVPRFGYRHAAAERQKNWLVEVPANADPLEDQFAKKAKDRKEKVDKNEFQRLRNLAASKKIRVPKEGLPPVETPDAGQLGQAVKVARASTASLGRFQARLPKEKPLASGSSALPEKRKRRNHAAWSAEEERSHNLTVVNSLLNKRPTLDVEKAVNSHIHEEQMERAEEKRNRKPSKGGRKKQGRGPPRGRKAAKMSVKRAGGKRRSGRKK